jgi:dTDP-4-dehydrorhamnose reductase
LSPTGISLVVGGDGLLGSALRQTLEARGDRTLATSRRAPSTQPPPDPSPLHLDLSRQPPYALPQGVRRAWLLAATTGVEACASDPANARRVNVDHTVALARQLLDSGAEVVFASSSLVFDGDRPMPPPEHPARPRTLYGELKLEAERQLLALPGALASPGLWVLRLTKVWPTQGPRSDLPASWADELRAGRELHAFSDRWVAPLTDALAARALRDLPEAAPSGFWHLGPTDELCYADLALQLAQSLGAAQAQVRRIESGARAGGPAQGPHASLGSETTWRALGLHPPSSLDTLRALLPRLRSS